MISSNILYTQPFKAANDTILSFIYTDPGTDNIGSLLTENQDYLIQENGGDVILNSINGDIDGLSVFLVDAGDGTIPALLSGGGSQINNPGLNLITDTITTSNSAVSGIMLVAALDQSGYFGLANSLDQFTTGTASLSPANIVVRTFNKDLSTFDFKGSVSINTHEDELIVDKSFKIFSIGFKRHLQDVVIYNRTIESIETEHTFNTDIPLDSLPQYFRIGLSYSGDKSMEIKSLTVNGNIL
jgi:hypothetical protein